MQPEITQKCAYQVISLWHHNRLLGLVRTKQGHILTPQIGCLCLYCHLLMFTMTVKEPGLRNTFISIFH